MALIQASLLECKATARMFGPWPPLACAMGCAVAWLQEPLFLRGYGIDLLWDGGLAAVRLLFPVLALAWCTSRGSMGDWSRAGAGAPPLAVISGCIGLLAYGLGLALVVLTSIITLGSIYGGWGGPSQIGIWCLNWVAASLPLAFLAPGFANLRLPASVSALLWLAVAAIASGLATPPHDTVPSPAMLAASMMASLGSFLFSCFVVRTKP